MRKAFCDSLLEAAEKEESVMLITNDLGFSVLEPFEQKFPKRFLNVGVAEQNMIGVAAGVAHSAKKVFVYSIVPFVTMRCFEQIRNDVCSANLPVVLVGVGGGLSYGTAGLTHHSLNDIAIMRSLPNMEVFCPGDPAETQAIMAYLSTSQKPAYLRIGKGNDPIVHEKKPDFAPGKAILLRDGSDISIFATGNILWNAREAAKILGQAGLSVCLFSMPSVKPIDKEAIHKAARETKAIFSIEEHSIIGGLGGAVAETLAEYKDAKPLFARIGFPDSFCKEIGSQEYLRQAYGLSPEAMAERIQRHIKESL
ncbi:MAG: hypothetical protein HYT49_00310 [Candidatus Wildermuthbacteria bacterium]|nr:hypothetical protein [Candidatus Wildermuthbacteria bacterium]